LSDGNGQEEKQLSYIRQMKSVRIIFFCFAASVVFSAETSGRESQPSFRVVSFFTAKHDLAHISFVREAHTWFRTKAAANNFVYDSTSNWSNLNDTFLASYDVVVFLDTRPEHTDQREAFQRYVEKGGAWLGFHFAAFALDDSEYPDNWHWYNHEFLGCGQYKSNTWRPTSELLKIDAPDHPIFRNFQGSIESSPNEWYRWEKDLRENKDIRILLSLHEKTFPVGTGPKQHEIWQSGYYPVAWTNSRYRMVYLNMGHNDMDYDGGTNKELSRTFSSPQESEFIWQSLLWLANTKK
jgi:uncharacterized protein